MRSRYFPCFQELRHFVTAAMLTAALGYAAVVPTNSVTIADQSGTAQSGRPFTISRFFAKGEIPHFAQARVAGTPVLTQCDVKTRWPDGSVQHALVSFKADVPANSSLTADFIDQSTGNNTGYLAAADMLDATRFNFGAQIELTNGTTLAANARTMLSAGKFRYWLQGSVCTQVIIEDNSAALAYDMGWSGKPLHPIFVATFYPGFNGVKVEMIVENMWTTRLANQTYSVALKTGQPLNATAVYTKASFTQIAASRWRKAFWSGAAPGNVNIDYNFAYLIYSRALPYYDQSRTLSSSAISSEISAFNATDQGDLGGSAEWTLHMPDPGGLPDRAVVPRWYIRYLWSFNPGLYAVLLGNAEAGAHIPVHYRESATGRYFDSAHTVDAFSKPISIDARPTVRTDDPDNSKFHNTSSADLLTMTGAVSNGLWTVDEAHQPDPAYVPYLITGDWYFLEEMYFWASYDLATGNPDTSSSCNYCRAGSLGIFHEATTEIRGIAWTFRNLGHAVVMAPDGSAEKAYFTQKMNNNIAVREGMYNLTNGSFYDASSGSLWSMGKNQFAAFYGPNPLHFLEQGGLDNIDIMNANVVSAVTSPWMVNYCNLVFGHLKELGLPIGAVQQAGAQNLMNQILNGAYNPYLSSYYRMPLRDTTGKYFTTWAAVKSGFPSADQATTTWSGYPTDANLSYPLLALAASSYLPGITDGTLAGDNAWSWMQANVPNQSLLNDNLIWAFAPRPVSAPVSRTCDLNGDGVVNSSDVTISQNQALAIVPCGTADLDGNGSCNIVDIQRVISAALGNACRVGL